MSKNHSYDKDAWRQRNLAWITKPENRLLDDKGKLRHRYLELVGDSGADMYKKMRKLLREPTQFIAVDVSAEVLFKHMMSHWKPPTELDLSKDFKWRKEDVFALRLGDVFLVANLEIRNGPEIGVFNLDFESTALTSWWEGSGRSVRNLVQSRFVKGQPFVVILNHTIDQPGKGGISLLQEHAKNIAKYAVPDGYHLDVDKMVAGLDKVDPDFLGQVGGFDVYKSEGRRWRMATVRLAYDPTRRNSRYVRFDVGQ